MRMLGKFGTLYAEYTVCSDKANPNKEIALLLGKWIERLYLFLATNKSIHVVQLLIHQYTVKSKSLNEYVTCGLQY